MSKGGGALPRLPTGGSDGDSLFDAPVASPIFRTHVRRPPLPLLLRLLLSESEREAIKICHYKYVILDKCHYYSRYRLYALEFGEIRIVPLRQVFRQTPDVGLTCQFHFLLSSLFFLPHVQFKLTD